MRSSKLAGVAAIAIFAVAACGGSGSAPTGGTTTSAPTSAPAGATTTPASAPAGATTTPATAGTPIDLCALLSPADLKTVTGGDYGAGVTDSVGQCTWRVGGATANNGDGQVIAGTADATLDVIKGNFPGGTDVTVSGHAGYWNPAQGLQSIWVDAGGRLLVLSFDPVDSDTLGFAQKLAEIAIGKM
jgi:hypothetical protein